MGYLVSWRRVGQQLRDVGQQKQQVFFGSADYGLQQLVVDKQQREFELSDYYPDLSDEVFPEFDEVIDELKEVGFDVHIYSVSVLLDVDH